jgi:uncharacterized protein YbjT (DUF2867 family)
VAEFAVRSHTTPGALNQTLDVGGPQHLSPRQVLAIFERISGDTFETQLISEDALLAQLQQTADPLAESFAKLQLEYAHGSVSDSSAALALMPMSLTSVEDYASAVCGQTAAPVSA